MGYRQIMQLSSEDAAYIAGLVDGEGTITLMRKHRNENRQLAVTISSTERVLLEFVLERLGVGKITNKRTTSNRHTPSFTYSVYNRQALSLLFQIGAFLRSYKVERCKLALQDYVNLTPRNGKYTKVAKAARIEFEEKFLNIKPNK